MQTLSFSVLPSRAKHFSSRPPTALYKPPRGGCWGAEGAEQKRRSLCGSARWKISPRALRATFNGRSINVWSVLPALCGRPMACPRHARRLRALSVPTRGVRSCDAEGRGRESPGKRPRPTRASPVPPHLLQEVISARKGLPDAEPGKNMARRHAARPKASSNTATQCWVPAEDTDVPLTRWHAACGQTPVRPRRWRTSSDSKPSKATRKVLPQVQTQDESREAASANAPGKGPPATSPEDGGGNQKASVHWSHIPKVFTPTYF